MNELGRLKAVGGQDARLSKLAEKRHGFPTRLLLEFMSAANFQGINPENLKSVFCNIYSKPHLGNANANSLILVKGKNIYKTVNFFDGKKVTGEWLPSVSSGSNWHMEINLENIVTEQKIVFGQTSPGPFLRAYRAMLLLEALPDEIYQKNLSHCWVAGGIPLNRDEEISVAYIERRVGQIFRKNMLEMVPADLLTPLILMRDYGIYPDMFELLETLSFNKHPQGAKALLLLAEIATIRQMKINSRPSTLKKRPVFLVNA